MCSNSAVYPFHEFEDCFDSLFTCFLVCILWFTGYRYISWILLSHRAGFHCKQTRFQGRKSKRSSGQNGQLCKSVVSNLMLLLLHLFAAHTCKDLQWSWAKHFTLRNERKINASKLSGQQQCDAAPLSEEYHPGKMSALKLFTPKSAMWHKISLRA